MGYIKIIKEATKAVPAIKYALGVAGLGAVVALVVSFNIDLRIAVWGVLILIVLMVLLLVFAKMSKSAPDDFRLPSKVLMWFVIVIMICTCTLLVSSVFFKYPVNLRHWIDGKAISQDSINDNSGKIYRDDEKRIRDIFSIIISSIPNNYKSLISGVEQEDAQMITYHSTLKIDKAVSRISYSKPLNEWIYIIQLIPNNEYDDNEALNNYNKYCQYIAEYLQLPSNETRSDKKLKVGPGIHNCSFLKTIYTAESYTIEVSKLHMDTKQNSVDISFKRR